MKILVTGGLGFIGSAVVRLALMRGHQIVNVDALTYAGNAKNLADIDTNAGYDFEHLDISNQRGLDEAFERHAPDTVMHLAAETHVDRSIINPRQFIETNVSGTLNLLEAARKYWVNSGEPSSFRFHHVSTDEVFGSLPMDPNVKFKEDSPYDPRSPYSASKAASDHLVRAWFTTYGLPVILTNCSNNYGPRQFPEKLIPLALAKALSGAPIPIYGDGKNVRDWIYVEDHAEALIIATERGVVGRSYNFGGDCERSNLELISSLCEILDQVKPLRYGTYNELITFVRDRPGHDRRYAIDNSRARSELNWEPSTPIEQGLEKTVQWYLNNSSEKYS